VLHQQSWLNKRPKNKQFFNVLPFGKQLFSCYQVRQCDCRKSDRGSKTALSVLLNCLLQVVSAAVLAVKVLAD
jgi:hypothetical protein